MINIHKNIKDFKNISNIKDYVKKNIKIEEEIT